MKAGRLEVGFGMKLFVLLGRARVEDDQYSYFAFESWGVRVCEDDSDDHPLWEGPEEC